MDRLCRRGAFGREVRLVARGKRIEGLLEMGERLLGVAVEAVRSGLLGYALFVGRAEP
jgi:hypothetical protein